MLARQVQAVLEPAERPDATVGGEPLGLVREDRTFVRGEAIFDEGQFADVPFGQRI